MSGENVTRRGFLGSALAAMGMTSVFGRRVFAAPGWWKPSGQVRLRFGVVSDSHLRVAKNGTSLYSGTPSTWFSGALNYFKAQGVDAVMHCGDFADRGSINALQFHADVWNSVFGPDSPVVKLFVTGNHDIVGGTYGNPPWVSLVWKDDPTPHLLVTDLEKDWSDIWGEPYEEVWHKVVKGYHFFGYGWREGDALADNGLAMAELVRKAWEDGDIRGPRPFFTTSHVRPATAIRSALSPYTNGIGFFGHHHDSASRWDVIWWGDDAGYPFIQCPSVAYGGGVDMAASPLFAKAKPATGGSLANDGCRYYQVYLVTVYDDALVIHRTDVSDGHNNASLGPDWVMPIGDWSNEPYPGDHPFSARNLAAKIGTPEFASAAGLSLSCAQDSVTLTIPAAGDAESRVFGYNVKVTGDSGAAVLWKSVYAKGVNDGIGQGAYGGNTSVTIDKSELPAGSVLTFTVYPCSSLGTSGSPISLKRIFSRIDVEDSLPPGGLTGEKVTVMPFTGDEATTIVNCPSWGVRAAIEGGTSKSVVVYTRTTGASLRIKS